MNSRTSNATQCLLFSLLVGISPMCLAGDEGEINLNRYSKTTPVAEPQQIDPLSVVVKMKLPSSITTIGQAVGYLLEESGYRLSYSNDMRNQKLMNLPLPRVHRKLGPITLRNALATLTGKPWQLVQNDLDRTVTFQLNDAKAPSISSNTKVSDIKPEIMSAVALNNSNSSKFTIEKEWKLNPELTLSENFGSWVEKIGWRLDWTSSHDYVVSHEVVYRGTIQQAIEKVLEFYQSAPIPLNANFYTGNSVLVIEPAGKEESN